MRIAAGHLRLQPDLGQQPGHPCRAPRPCGRAQRLDAFADDLANRHSRIERGVGVLKDHLHFRAQRTQLPRRQTGQLRAVEHDPAAGRRDELQKGLGHRGLATAGFADQRQRAARRQRERDAIDRAHLPDRALQETAPDREMHGEIAHLEQGQCARRAAGAPGPCGKFFRSRERFLRCSLAKHTAHEMIRPHGMPWGRITAAGRHHLRTTRGETAAGVHLVRGRHAAGNRRQPPAAPSRIGQRGEQPLRIWMSRRGEERLARRGLDQLAGIHDADAIGHPRHHAEIVADEQECHALLPAQVVEHLQHLGLDGDIERGGRFVGDQQTRPTGQRHGDHHPLLHAARHLEGIGVKAGGRIGDADLAQEFHRPLPCRRAAQAFVQGERLADLLADAQHGVETGRRLLKDHADTAPAHAAHVVLGKAQQVAALETDFAGSDHRSRRQEAQDGERRQRLAAARFAKQGKAFAGGDFERHAVDRPRPPAIGEGNDEREIAYRQQRRHDDVLGSKASRTASANRLAARTRTNMKPKAATSDHQTIGSRASSMRAALIMVPKEMVVGSTPTPT